MRAPCSPSERFGSSSPQRCVTGWLGRMECRRGGDGSHRKPKPKRGRGNYGSHRKPKPKEGEGKLGGAICPSTYVQYTEISRWERPAERGPPVHFSPPTTRPHASDAQNLHGPIVLFLVVNMLDTRGKKAPSPVDRDVQVRFLLTIYFTTKKHASGVPCSHKRRACGTQAVGINDRVSRLDAHSLPTGGMTLRVLFFTKSVDSPNRRKCLRPVQPHDTNATDAAAGCRLSNANRKTTCFNVLPSRQFLGKEACSTVASTAHFVASGLGTFVQVKEESVAPSKPMGPLGVIIQ